jgi:DNA polymerase-3 subunit gamma/tau
MLYRRYRPQKFSELVGLEAVKKTLLSQLKDGKIGHAYLFAGPQGTGKTTTARILAKAINCEKGGSEPCGKCVVCKQVEEGRYLDLIEIDAASNRGIDDIRALRERVKLAPSSGEKKIYIIDEVHMLTIEAFNALLKTLEEPPSHAIFILCTTEPHKLPATIRSRCQQFDFKSASVPHLVERLADICRREKISLSEEALTEIARASGGGFRDAETILEQAIVGGQKVEDLVGLVRLDNLDNFFDALLGKNTGDAIRYLNELRDKGVSMENLNKKILEYLRDLLLIKVGVGESLVEAGERGFSKMKSQAGSLSSDQLRNMINKFTQSYENLTQSSIPTLPLEVAIVEVSADEEPAPFSTAEVKNEDPDRKKTSNRPKREAGGQWDELMKSVKPLNHSVEALLRSCEPAEVKGSKIIIKAFYPFHKERLEDSRNRAILEKAAKDVYGKKLTLQVKLAQQ